MEAMGLMPPYSSSNPSEGPEKQEECLRAGNWMAGILRGNLRPRDIVTRASLANAVAMIGAAGGSTNGILHILALALEAGVDFDLKDIQAVLRNTPVYCNFAPRGKGTMIDLFKLGGTPMLIKHLVNAGVLDGSTPTLFAKSLHEQVKNAIDVPPGQDLIAPALEPFKDFADVQVCFGNLAPDGIVFKVSSRREAGFEGQAICFNDADSLVAAVNEGRVRPGHVVVLRGMGPVAMGMPEVLLATAALSTPELDGKVALISDARVSGVSHGAIGVHCSPEAAVGGPVARVTDGDVISFDLLKGVIDWKGCSLDDNAEIPAFPAFNGREIYLREFSQNTTQAHQGCVSKQVLPK
jgi:dihydroxy-acid dehydratase